MYTQTYTYMVYFSLFTYHSKCEYDSVYVSTRCVARSVLITNYNYVSNVRILTLTSTMI